MSSTQQLAFAITLPEIPRSMDSFQNLTRSSEAVGNPFAVHMWHGTPAHEAIKVMKEERLEWTYPLTGSKVIGGLTCTPYSGNHWARVACALSHLHLWKYCAQLNLPFIVHEDDSEYVRRFDPAEVSDAGFGAVSLNNPHGATRSASLYHRNLVLGISLPYLTCAPCPWVDEDASQPQGLPGNSAYYLQPWFAAELIAKVWGVGLIPNDSLMCRQWFPGKLACLRNYATKTNGRTSLIR